MLIIGAGGDSTVDGGFAKAQVVFCVPHPTMAFTFPTIRILLFLLCRAATAESNIGLRNDTDSEAPLSDVTARPSYLEGKMDNLTARPADLKVTLDQAGSEAKLDNVRKERLRGGERLPRGERRHKDLKTPGQGE